MVREGGTERGKGEVEVGCSTSASSQRRRGGKGERVMSCVRCMVVWIFFMTDLRDDSNDCSRDG